MKNLETPPPVARKSHSSLPNSSCSSKPSTGSFSGYQRSCTPQFNIQAFLYTFKLQKLQVKQVQKKLNFTPKCLLFAQLLYAKPPNKHLRQEQSVNKHLIFQIISQVTDVEQSCTGSSVLLWVTLLLLSSFPLRTPRAL